MLCKRYAMEPGRCANDKYPACPDLRAVIAIFITLGLAGAIYEHRAAPPMVGFMFVALILFGLTC
ncbi:hypothetical protein C8R21_1566 [Nitrosospira multiformis]|uniref:Uncharacterized protein n=2 Tax=Nitrosospira multiformis TaxID=1231 RepID=A0A2T5I059_9PROT|nr:hypothetical protein C8R21_1566 [Nitrosospira multiformis]